MALSPSGRKERSAVGSAAATGVLVACSLVVAGLSVRQALFPPPPPSEVPSTTQKDWLQYAAVGSSLGSPNAKPALVVFSDYQCPWCKRLDDVLHEVLAEHDEPLRFVYRHWPITSIHPQAKAAALAAICADQQSRFEAMSKLLYGKKDSLGLISWRDLATRAEVRDLDEFDRCVVGEAAEEILVRDSLDAVELQVIGTPTVLVAGRRINGSVPKDQLKRLLGLKATAGARSASAVSRSQ